MAEGCRTPLAKRIVRVTWLADDLFDRLTLRNIDPLRVSSQDFAFVDHLDLFYDLLPLLDVDCPLPADLWTASVHPLLLILFGDFFGLAILLELRDLTVVEDLLHEGRLRRLDVFHLHLYPVEFLVIDPLRPHVLVQSAHVVDASHFLDGAVCDYAFELFGYHLFEVFFARAAVISSASVVRLAEVAVGEAT